MEIDDPLERTELTFLLGMAFQLVLSEFVDRLDAVGYAELRPMHGLVFQALRGPGATTSELAEQLGVTKQAAGQIVDDLEKRGYVERRPHPAGGRRRLVVLTGKALEHLSVAGRILHELEAQLARGRWRRRSRAACAASRPAPIPRPRRRPTWPPP
ncbi:MarR family winged helix-turn-helix transcriptional regulator, partial [Streptomyces asiaticus]